MKFTKNRLDIICQYAAPTKAETRRMIMLEVQKQCFVGFKGERFRFYPSDKGYQNAKRSEQEGEIKVKSHAAVVTGKATLPLRRLCLLPLCGLTARNYLTLPATSVRQVFRNPAILF